MKLPQRALMKSADTLAWSQSGSWYEFGVMEASHALMLHLLPGKRQRSAFENGHCFCEASPGGPQTEKHQKGRGKKAA